MLQQQPLALPPPAGPAAWEGQALLDLRTSRGLASLNEAFLRLLFDAQQRRPGQPAYGLEPAVWPPPPPAPPGAVALAGLPCALFALGFRDARLWQAQVQRGGSVQDGPGQPGPESAALAFTRQAMVFAWHLADARDRAARLVLGLEPATAAALAEVPVGQLEGCAQQMAPRLAARFSGREAFWRARRDTLWFPSDLVTRARLRRLALQLQGMDSARQLQLQRRVIRPTPDASGPATN